jgi:prepilin-type N-terminal cleavage/methylation domain-containing protein
MKRAFTLIELLVVIAIIAILAAILFPVFAQAKVQAKKATTVSNTKQEMLSALMYANDVDDCSPMAMGVRPDGTGTWGVGVIHPVPYNVVTTSPWTQPERYLMAESFWANSTFPYTKNYGIVTVTVNKNVNTVPDTFLAGVTPADVGITYNGLFHCLSGGSVNAPANAVMFWDDQALNYIGRGLSSPALDCGNVAGVGALQSSPIACGFNPSGPASANGDNNGGIFYVFDFTTPVWIFGQHQVVGYADGHAKSGTCGATIAPAQGAPSSSIADPWAQVTATGAPSNYWPCGVGGPSDLGATAIYPCFFRPDRTW